MQHPAYLSLGSNIEPEIYLPRAIDLLKERSDILSLSSAWESEAVGSEGPNFLNACLLLKSPFTLQDLREGVLHPIETVLGRQRTDDKYAPRTIDIDVVIFDDRSCNAKFWNMAYVVVPLAEIYPRFQNPLMKESILETATRLRQSVWIEPRPEVFAL